MFISALCGNATARSAPQKPFLDEEGFVEIFQGAAILADGGGDRLNTCRATAVLLDECGEDFSVDFIKAEFVHLEKLESTLSGFAVDETVATNLRKVAYSTQEAVGDAGRTTTAARYLVRTATVDLDFEQGAGTLNDLG